jgi:hypothetical protein
MHRFEGADAITVAGPARYHSPILSLALHGSIFHTLRVCLVFMY